MSNAYMQDEMSLLVDGSNFMIAPLDMGNKRLINLTSPIYPTDGASKDYVDNAGSTVYLKLDGTNNMTASLNVGNHTIINVVDPTADQQAATKKYVDSGNALMVKKDGSVAMTGSLDLGTHSITNLIDPTSNQQAATKKYVDLFTLHDQIAPTFMNANNSPAPYVASTNNTNATHPPWHAFDGN